MPALPKASSHSKRSAKLPTAKEIRAASRARVEARKAAEDEQAEEARLAKLRVTNGAKSRKQRAAKLEPVADREVAQAEADNAEAEASLKVIAAKTQTAQANRRAAAALRRAENTEAMLLREQERVAELEAALSAAPGDGKFDGNAAHSFTEGAPLPGRKTGTVAKTARANLYAAFEDMGGVEELVRWGRGNPTEFYRIWARLIPVEVEDESKNMPLETLLEMLSKRADQTVEQAAVAIGQEILDRAEEEVDVEAAASLFKESQQ